MALILQGRANFLKCFLRLFFASALYHLPISEVFTCSSDFYFQEKLQLLFAECAENFIFLKTTSWQCNCIYWRPQHWRLVVNSEVVNPECIYYINWRPYLVWFIFVPLCSGGWFGLTWIGKNKHRGAHRTEWSAFRRSLKTLTCLTE